MAVLQRLPVDDALLDEFWPAVENRESSSYLLIYACRALLRARDVDLLVTFASDARWGLFEHEHMERELAERLGRNVDLVSRRAIESSENALRRDSILAGAVPVYVSR